MLHIDIIYLACRGQKYATIRIGPQFPFSYRKSRLNQGDPLDETKKMRLRVKAGGAQ